MFSTMIRLLVILGVSFGVLLSVSQPARAEEDKPVVGWAAPRLATPPEIDGRIGGEEWRYASQINALQANGRGVSKRPVTWMVTWDPEHLYVAMRSPLRPGERPVQSERRKGRDKNVVWDDSFELWIDIGSESPEGLPVFFQYMSNLAGVKLDTMHIPTAGNQRMSWTAEWDVVNRLTEDNVWEMEMAIPRDSIYAEQAFQAGQTVKVLFARNLKRPWEQNSITGTGSFIASDTYSRVTLTDPGPAVHFGPVADVPQEEFFLNLAIANPLDAPARVKYRAWTTDQTLAESAIDAPPGTVSDSRSLIDPLERDPKREYGIEVTHPETGQLMLAWSSERMLGRRPVEPELDDRGDVVKLRLAYNPIGNYLVVDGDLIQFDDRDRLTRFEVEVLDGEGEVLEQRELRMDELAYVANTMDLPELEPGEYTARLRGYTESGEALIDESSTFERKDHASFAWWNTERGDWNKVLDPWTPVQWEEKTRTLGVLDRTYRLGGAGLPERVTSRGKDVLAGPIRLEMDAREGRVIRSDTQPAKAMSIQQREDWRVVTNTTAALGELEVSSRITAEYDGMVKYEMTFTPRGPVELEGLRLHVPVDAELARLYHMAGRGIRHGFDFGFLPGHGGEPQATGGFWNSRRVDGQGMVVGSFVPYAWLGETDAGLAWFADSDEGWIPNDRVPGLEMTKPSPDTVELVLNLISESTVLTEPRTVVFAFQATPVKPGPEAWRDEPWSTGSTFKDFQMLDEAGGHQIWTNVPFPLDVKASAEKVADYQQATTNYFAGGTPVDRLYAVPYLEWKRISGRFAPEVRYFSDQWITDIGDGLWFTPSLRDYLVWHLSNWIDVANIDGVYLDNVRPTIGNDLKAGQGYELPDGRVQPTFQMFETRELFLRFRALFHEKGKRGKFVLHMTNNFIAPWVGPADVLLDGEHHTVFADSGATFMDYWSLPRLQLAYPRRWGNAVTFLQLHKGRWDPQTLQKTLRAYFGLTAVHDVLSSANSNGQGRAFFHARYAFGLGDEGVAFVPYWRDGGAIAGDDADRVLASAWTHPEGRAMIVVANRGESPTTVTLRLDAEALGLTGDAAKQVRDAELRVPEDKLEPRRPNRERATPSELFLMGLEPIRVEDDGSIVVPIAGEDYRMLWVGEVPDDAFDY